MSEKLLFELQFGFKDEPYRIEVRDRYGAQEKRRQRQQAEWKELKEELAKAEAKLPPRKERGYNKWKDLTQTRFWQKYARCSVTYHGIETRFKDNSNSTD